MAEVLITLAIIGVVAALTIPTVVAKYQKHQYYTQFMKVYNTLSNAFALAEADHGKYGTWGIDDSVASEERKGIFEANFLPYLKVAKVCDEASECGLDANINSSVLLNAPSDSPMSYGDFFDFDSSYYQLHVILQDGTYLRIAAWGTAHFEIDTNGQKGPNIVGRDIFRLEYAEFGGTYKLIGQDMISNASICKDSNGNTMDAFYAHFMGIQVTCEATIKYATLDDAKKECSTEEETYGETCATRLLLEGKMNY